MRIRTITIEGKKRHTIKKVKVQEASHDKTTNIDLRKSTRQKKIPSFLKDYFFCQ